MTWSDEYRGPGAFWAALKSRAKVEARAQGTRPDLLTGLFVRQMFLARVFSAEERSPWVVAGGTGMLIRLPGARTTDDLDLVRRSPSRVATLADDLADHVGTSPSDPFEFRVVKSESFSGEIEGVKVRISALINGRRAHEFDVDLTEKTLIGRVDTLTPEMAVSGLRGVECPPIPVYPVASQVADKLSAMYRHMRSDGPTVSTRYRDLVDLVLLSCTVSVDAAAMRDAIAHLRQDGGIPVPKQLVTPGDEWTVKYPEYAKQTALPAEFHHLDPAIDQVGRWLNPVLSGDIREGYGWDPRTSSWRRGGEIDVLADDTGTVAVRAHTRDDGATPVTDHHRSPPHRSQ